MNKYIVITTINPKSEGIIRFESLNEWKIIVVGDKKSPHIESSGNVTFLSVEDQKKLGYDIVEVCPYNHYTRKNIGYLYAIESGADVIYDTDDDNLPYDNWGFPEFSCSSNLVSNQKYINIYKYFSKEIVWPRGFPLDEIHNGKESQIKDIAPVDIGVWQGLADIDPDVDAIFRLTVNKEIRFEDRPPVSLEKGHYCPSNSQNTLWNKKAFPYLYLPATTSFRFTDILRGYIAQRLLWEQDLHLGFTKATVYQERNVHDLMRDFKDEIECYLGIKPIVSLLDSLEFGPELISNVQHVYRALVERKIINAKELLVFDAWSEDYIRIIKRGKQADI